MSTRRSDGGNGKVVELNTRKTGKTDKTSKSEKSEKSEKPIPEHQQFDYIARKDALIFAVRAFKGRSANGITHAAKIFHGWLRDGQVPDEKIGG